MDKRRRVEPGLGQESVWDYPRPPRLEESHQHIQVIFITKSILGPFKGGAGTYGW